MADIGKLKRLANENRKRIIKMIYKGKAGHPGGSLSIIDILTAVYDLDVDFQSEQRSKVILSKGHGVPAQYAVLNALGFIRDEELNTLRQCNSRLQGHPHILDIPETDATTGLLGQGLSLGVGVALAKRSKGDESHIYVFLGDGELMEGQIWEACFQAAHYKLSRLIVILDSNQLSSSGPVSETIGIGDPAAKFRAFGFKAFEADGNDMEGVVSALKEAWNVDDGPVAIIANTVKGKGVSFMENNPKWHSGALTDEEYQLAMSELSR